MLEDQLLNLPLNQMVPNGGYEIKQEARNKKLSLYHAHEVAKTKNGRCLSESYINVDAKLKWECEFGHRWEASLYNVRKIGSWCHHCAGFAKLTID